MKMDASFLPRSKVSVQNLNLPAQYVLVYIARILRAKGWTTAFRNKKLMAGRGKNHGFKYLERRVWYLLDAANSFLQGSQKLFYGYFIFLEPSWSCVSIHITIFFYYCACCEPQVLYKNKKFFTFPEKREEKKLSRKGRRSYGLSYSSKPRKNNFKCDACSSAIKRRLLSCP